MSADDVFEPLRGKRRSARQALIEVAERWVSAPVLDTAGRQELQDAVRHLLRRGQLRRELPAGADVDTLAETFVRALVAGKGRTAVEDTLGAPASGPE